MVAHLLQTYGYAAVFLFVMLESLGVPVPGETMLIAAALYAGTTGHLSIAVIITVAAVAAIVGDNIGYLIGRRGGYRLLERYGAKVRLHEGRVKIGRLLFLRHGGKIVFYGRFVSVLRTYAAFLAGTTQMAWRRFLVFNASGGVVWATAYGVAYYYGGSLLERASTPVDITLGVAATLVLVAGFLYARHHEGRLLEQAEQVFPGDLRARPVQPVR